MSPSISADDLLAQVMQRNDSLQTTAAPSEDAPAELCLGRLAECMQESALSVFSKMCGIEITAAEQRDGPAEERYELSGIVGISGAMKATAVINVSRSLAFAVAEAFTGETPTDIDDGVIDMIGELANMIGGNAKERLSNPALSLGLPTVVTGEGHGITFSPDMTLRTLAFASPHGPLQLEMGASEKKIG